MTQFNVEVELDTTDDLTDDQIDALMEDMEPIHGVVGRSELGRTQLTFTLDDGVPFVVGPEWALTTAAQWSMRMIELMIVQGLLPAPAISLRVMPTADFDKINDLEVLPGLFGNDD